MSTSAMAMIANVLLLTVGAALIRTQTAPPSSAPTQPPATTAKVVARLTTHIQPETALDAQHSIRRGLDYLRATQDRKGGWTAAFGPAITAMAAQAFAQSPEFGPSHPIVRRAVANALGHQQDDGGVYQTGLNLANYQTSVVVMMLASIDDPLYKDNLFRAVTFLRRLQYGDNDDIRADNPWYGGAGYTKWPAKRPDLSNTQMMIEALHQSGLPADDPAYQRAVTFISRCQMWGETNDQPFASGSANGGFIYSAANKGESKAGVESVDGRRELRAYGSMTYAGFKSLLYAKLDRKDPRVTKALEWIGNHWTLDGNPNMPGKQGHEGLYYYYHVFARALRAWGEPYITDSRGIRHNWREELIRKVISLQNKDGSWVNSRDRWAEGEENYITAMTVMTLQESLRGD